MARRALGRIETAAGNPEEAEAHVAAPTAFDEIGARFDAAATRLDLVELGRRRGAGPEATAALLAAGAPAWPLA